MSVMATDYTNDFPPEAIMIIFYLPAAWAEGAANPKAREKMAYASTMAGMAFANAFLGICHSMAHKLGSAFHVPHGLANALLISDVIRFNAVEAPTKQAAFPQYKYPLAIERYARIADYLGLGGKTSAQKVEKLIEAVEDLKKKIDIPANLKDAGVDEKAFMDTLDELSEMAFDDQCTGGNPRYPLVKEIAELYKKAYYGK